MPRTRPLASVAALILLSSPALSRSALAQPDAPPGVPVTRYDGHTVVSVTITTAQQLQAVTALADSVWSHHTGIGADIDVQLAPGKLAILDQLNIKYRVLIPDLQRVIDAETADIHARALRDDITWYQNYHNLADINTYMDQLAAAHPDLAQIVNVGPSLEGRMIRALKITGPDLPGNPKAARSTALFNAAQHAREWITPPTVLWFAEQLLTKYDSDPRLHDLVDNLEFNLIPVTNPDGYQYTWISDRFWRKNRRLPSGVDNNRNWGFRWGSDEGSSGIPGSETFRGASPFSEPENQAMRDFFLANPRIRVYLDVHSYGPLIMSPWGWTSELPPQPDAAIFASLDAEMSTAIASIHSMVYTPGPLYTTLYPVSGGSIDWAYGDRGIPGFTIELRGPGFNPPASHIIPGAEEAFAGLLRLAEHYGAPLSFTFHDGQPSLIPSDAPSSLRIIISNHTGTLDPAAARIYTRASSLNPFTPAPLTVESGTVYTAPIPATPCGAVLDYYFEAATTDGRTVRFPSAAPSSLFSADALDTQVTFSDDFETDKGWTVGLPSDTATAGIWERVDPALYFAQPDTDTTPSPGVLCFITDGRLPVGGNYFDVDRGATTLTSPTFSALPASAVLVDTVLSYSRWYSNADGGTPNDTMSIQISGDDGATWKQLELISQGADLWVRRSFSFHDLHITPTDQMKLRLIARDLGTDSIVEAGLDDVQVEAFFCPASTSPADLNGDGVVDFADYLEFLNLYEAMDPRVDFNHDGIIDFLDYIEFLNYFST